MSRVAGSELPDAEHSASSFLAGGKEKLPKPNLWEPCVAVPLAGCVFLASSAELFLINLLERS